MKGRSALAGILALAISTAACTTVAPLDAPDAPTEAAADEQELHALSLAAAEELRAAGLVLTDPFIDEYNSRVLGSLVPDNLSRELPLAVHVLRTSDTNAFALPHGEIFLTVGILFELDTEAKLATVLAHELGHVVARHGLAARRSAERSGVAAEVAGLLTLGTFGGLTYMPAALGLAAYSRDQEEEADRYALTRLLAAGYDGSEAAATMEVLAATEAGKGGDSWLASHPESAQRAEALRRMLAELPAAEAGEALRGAQAMQAVRAAIASEYLRLLLVEQRWVRLCEVADALAGEGPGEAWIHCRRGEALRRLSVDPAAAVYERARDEGRDVQVAEFDGITARIDDYRHLAESAFERCRQLDPASPQALRGLGLVAAERGEAARARELLQGSLAADPGTADRRYLESVLVSLGAAP